MTTINRFHISTLTAIMLFLLAGITGEVAWGLAPPDAGRLLQEMQKAAPPEQPEKKPAVVPVPQEPTMKERKEAKIFVKGFTFSMDFPVVPESELQQIVKDYTNREVTFGELEEAARKVTAYLRMKGYFLAKAYIPQQEILDGIVKINVIIGKAEVGKDGKVVEVQGERKRLRESAVQDVMGDTIKADKPMELGDLERGLLLINDLPEVTASANLSAGSTPGTTKIGLKVDEGHLITGNAGFDTFGNRYTGQERFLGNFNVNDLTGYGDVITFNGMQAGEPVFNVNKGNMWLWRAGWQAPAGCSGLKAGVAYTSLGYRVGKELSTLDSHGTARTWSANASYPVIRSRENNLYASIMYEHRDLFDATEIAVTDNKRLNVLTLGVNGDAIDSLGKGARTAYGLSVVGGRLDRGREPADMALDQQTAKTNGDYWKLLYNGARLQNIGSGFSLYGALSGQYAGKNLDTSEQFILGGPNGVRAYPSGEAAGDDGVLINMELRRDFPGSTPVGHVQAVAFYDYGWTVLHKDTWADWNSSNPSLKNSYGLSGAGAGLNISRTSLYLVKVFWAEKVGPNPGRTGRLDSDGKRSDSRFWVLAMIFF